MKIGHWHRGRNIGPRQLWQAKAVRVEVELAFGESFKIAGQGLEGQAAEFPQEPAVAAEEDPQHPGDGEDNLAVGDVEKSSDTR